MKNFSARPTFFGVIAAILGVLALGVAALWKNAIVNRRQTMDEYTAATGVDALIIGAFVVVGGLLLIGAIILIVIGWFAGQHQNDETYMPDPSRPGEPYPIDDHTMLPPVQPGPEQTPPNTDFPPDQPHSSRF